MRAQEARRRWETMCQIRKDKFDYVCLMNFCTDVKRMAYVLEHGEGKPPAGIQHAFDKALEFREIVRRNIKPSTRATAWPSTR